MKKFNTVSIRKNLTKFHLAKNLQAERTIISHSYKLFTGNLQVTDNNSPKPKGPKQSELCYLPIGQFF